MYSRVTYEPRPKNTNPHYNKTIPLDVNKDNLNIECINHILYGDDPTRNFEYYKQLNSKYKQILDNLLAEHNLQIIFPEKDSLRIELVNR